MLLQEFNARLSHGYFMSIKNQRDAIRQHVDDPCTVKYRTWVVTGIKKDGTAAKRWYKLTFVSESGFSAFELSQNMHQLHFVGVARKGNNLILLHNPTKKAWCKSLRHATIKENLIVKIEISYSFLVLCILRVKVGPTAHPVVTAVEGADVGYGVETGPAGETCGSEQWTSGDRSIAISTY